MVCEKPSYFTKEWYIDQKKIRRCDMEIAIEMDVSVDTMRKWKKEMGIEEMRLRRACAIPNHFTQDWYDKQKKMGKKDIEIAIHDLFISKFTMTRWKREKGIVQAK